MDHSAFAEHANDEYDHCYSYRSNQAGEEFRTLLQSPNVHSSTALDDSYYYTNDRGSSVPDRVLLTPPDIGNHQSCTSPGAHEQLDCTGWSCSIDHDHPPSSKSLDAPSATVKFSTDPLILDHTTYDTGFLSSTSAQHPLFASCQRQGPRFEGDLYTAIFVRGIGIAREGRCGHCYKWYKLKDSAYNYHLQFTHGICYTTGRPFHAPLEERTNLSSSQFEALCATCDCWVPVSKGLETEKGRTIWYRHASKCAAKSR